MTVIPFCAQRANICGGGCSRESNDNISERDYTRALETGSI